MCSMRHDIWKCAEHNQPTMHLHLLIEMAMVRQIRVAGRRSWVISRKSDSDCRKIFNDPPAIDVGKYIGDKYLAQSTCKAFDRLTACFMHSINLIYAQCADAVCEVRMQSDKQDAFETNLKGGRTAKAEYSCSQQPISPEPPATVRMLTSTECQCSETKAAEVNWFFAVMPLSAFSICFFVRLCMTVAKQKASHNHSIERWSRCKYFILSEFRISVSMTQTNISGFAQNFISHPKPEDAAEASFRLQTFNICILIAYGNLCRRTFQ